MIKIVYLPQSSGLEVAPSPDISIYQNIQLVAGGIVGPVPSPALAINYSIVYSVYYQIQHAACKHGFGKRKRSVSDAPAGEPYD